jgi:zinc protease
MRTGDMSSSKSHAGVGAWRLSPRVSGRDRTRLLDACCALLAAAALALPAFPALGALSIQLWQTASGARVYFVESHDLPILDLRVEFPAGSSRDTSSTSGLAGLTLRMLRYGAQGLTEEDISRRVADVGAQLTPSFDYDRAGYALRTLSGAAQRGQAVATLAAILQRPTFPAAVLEREKARVIAGLREAELKPEAIGAREFARLVYGGHPYGLRESGEPQTVAQLKREELAAFHARFFAAPHAVVAIIGDVDRRQAEAIAERLSAGLPVGAHPLPPLPPVPPLSAPVERAIDHPAAQAHLYLGAPGVRRTDPDYFPLLVGNYILGGGGFNSRFTEEVREKRGLSYSVYSRFAPYEQHGAFTIGLQTRKDQADEALRVVRETLAQFVANGPTGEELEGARQHIVGSFPLRIDSNRKILEYLAVIGFYRLPLDWLERYPENVAAVTAAQIRDAFQRRISPDRLVVVVVGGAPSKGRSAPP